MNVTSTLPGAEHAARAVEVIDLVLREQERDAVDVALHALVLEGQHLGEVELRLRRSMPMAAKRVARLLVELGGVQQRLGGDAADVEAGAAVRRPLLDHGRPSGRAGRADGAHIAAGAGADDDQIVGGSRQLNSVAGLERAAARRTPTRSRRGRAAGRSASPRTCPSPAWSRWRPRHRARAIATSTSIRRLQIDLHGDAAVRVRGTRGATSVMYSGK